MATAFVIGRALEKAKFPWMGEAGAALLLGLLVGVLLRAANIGHQLRAAIAFKVRGSASSAGWCHCTCLWRGPAGLGPERWAGRGRGGGRHQRAGWCRVCIHREGGGGGQGWAQLAPSCPRRCPEPNVGLGCKAPPSCRSCQRLDPPPPPMRTTAAGQHLLLRAAPDDHVRCWLHPRHTHVRPGDRGLLSDCVSRLAGAGLRGWTRQAAWRHAPVRPANVCLYCADG